jgi:hypothetical protein
LEPPPGYVEFVERHLEPLRRDAARAMVDEREAEELYPEVLTDVAVRWTWLELQRTRFNRPDAADTYLRRSFLRRSQRWSETQQPPIEFQVWRHHDGAPPPPVRTNAAVRLAEQTRSPARVQVAPIAEAAIAWWHAYEAHRRRRLLVVAVIFLLFVALIIRTEQGVGSAL